MGRSVPLLLHTSSWHDVLLSRGTALFLFFFYVFIARDFLSCINISYYIDYYSSYLNLFFILFTDCIVLRTSFL
jgi:hypothetical protein